METEKLLRIFLTACCAVTVVLSIIIYNQETKYPRCKESGCHSAKYLDYEYCARHYRFSDEYRSRYYGGNSSGSSSSDSSSSDDSSSSSSSSSDSSSSPSSSPSSSSSSSSSSSDSSNDSSGYSSSYSNPYSSYDEGYEDVTENEDYDWDRYYSDDDYAEGVDDAMFDMGW